MATISASAPTSSVARVAILPKVATGISSPAIVDLPPMARKGRVRCLAEEKPVASSVATGMSMGVSLLAAASATSMSSPVLALVDERMTTEGTGLSLGLSNNVLSWILVGVFGLIWALYFIYTSTLEEDEESGLSL